MFEGICDAIHREMEHLDEKYAAGTQLSAQDLASIDTMAHALKNLATYDAMKGERRRMTDRYSRYPDSYDRRY